AGCLWSRRPLFRRTRLAATRRFGRDELAAEVCFGGRYADGLPVVDQEAAEDPEDRQGAGDQEGVVERCQGGITGNAIAEGRVVVSETAGQHGREHRNSEARRNLAGD